MPTRIGKALDLLATLAVIAAGLSMTWVLMVNRQPAAQPNTTPQPYRVGEQFANLQGVSFADSPRTLVLWMSTGCRYCVESTGFYRDVIRSKGTTRVVVLGPESLEALTGFLAAHDLRPDLVLSVRRTEVKLYATPSLVLVDEKGIVQRVWKGMLPTVRDEKELLAALH